MEKIIKIIRGTTNTFDISITDESGAAYVLQDGETLRFGVKSSADDSYYCFCKTLTSENINESGDAYTLTLCPSDTEGLMFKRYCYDVGLQSGDDYYNVIPCSGFIVEHNITKWEA